MKFLGDERGRETIHLCRCQSACNLRSLTSKNVYINRRSTFSSAWINPNSSVEKHWRESRKCVVDGTGLINRNWYDYKCRLCRSEWFAHFHLISASTLFHQSQAQSSQSAICSSAQFLIDVRSVARTAYTKYARTHFPRALNPRQS